MGTLAAKQSTRQEFINEAASVNDIASLNKAAFFEKSLSGRESAITRYLSAAAYTDPKFRHKVIDEFVYQRYRAAAPELTIHPKTVIAHCQRAHRWKMWRDALLVGCLAPVILTGALTSALLDALEGSVPELGEYTVSIGMTWSLAFLVLFVEALYIRFVLIRKSFSLSAWSAKEPLSDEGKQNAVVYSGFLPFVGAGVQLESWSFAINLEKGARGIAGREEPKDFTVEQLYTATKNSLERLSIKSLCLHDQLFVDGKSIRNDRRFLPDIFSKPPGHLPHELVMGFRGRPTEDARHYLLAEIVDWTGDIVMSCFARYCKTGKQLFVEANFFITPPLKEEFYEIDKTGPVLFISDLVGWFVYALVYPPVFLVMALFTTARNLLAPIIRRLKWRKERKLVMKNERFDYGARTTIRTLASNDKYRIYFQRLDAHMHWKMVQKQLLDSLSQFLEEHGIDTSELADRGVAIINSGMIVAGGSVSAEGMAVGAGARAKVVIPQGGNGGNTK